MWSISITFELGEMREGYLESVKGGGRYRQRKRSIESCTEG
jgi:hypothetical protein